MKKASLLIWLIALMSCPVLSQTGVNGFRLYYFSSANQRRLEQSTDYQIIPLSGWQAIFGSRNQEDYRIDFDQNSRNILFNLSLLQTGLRREHEILSGYEYLYDYSDLESELNPYSNKTGFLGYGYRYSILDSLKLRGLVKGYYRQEQDRYLPGHDLVSKGMLGWLGMTYSSWQPDRAIQVSGSFEHKDLKWERYRQINASLSADFALAGNAVNTLVSLADRAEDLYVLTAPEDEFLTSRYSRYDRQLRRNLTAGLNVVLPLSGQLDMLVSEHYALSRYRHDVNRNRNTGDYNNQAQIDFNYRLTEGITARANVSHKYYLKDLSHISNTRIIDQRNLECGFAWEFLPSDSLLFDYLVALQRTVYPDSYHRLDNDYLTHVYNLGCIVFWKDRVRLANRFIFMNRDEVYLDSWLSANNNKVTGYQWQPQCDVLIGDRLLLQQRYGLRADYDDYEYSGEEDFGINDTFYRKAEAGFNLIWDTTPLAAKLTLPVWNRLPYRNRCLEAWHFDLGYAWERNETSEKKGEIYWINGSYDRQTISLLLQKQHGILILQALPKYSWGNWKEYNLILSSALQLNQNSMLELVLNPVGPDAGDLDWRLSCSLNMLF